MGESHRQALGTLRARRAALLAVIVGGALCLKLGAWPAPVGHHALDGSNYYQVARHVADGDGLRTRLSLYHQGFRSFPHETNIYPLWPLLLGYGARVVDLDTAAVGLPVLLYGLSLVLLYALTNALGASLPGGRVAPSERAPALTVGHLVALAFALNPVFFRHTSLPYAEGLTWATTFGALLALDRTRRGPPVLWATLAGLLAAAAFLSRPQMLPVAAALPIALLVGGRGRADRLAAGSSAVASFVAIGAWAWHLSGFVVPFSPRVLLDYAAYRETAELAPFPVTHDAGSWAGFVIDRLAGFSVAFDPFHPQAYARAFGAAVYLLPLALLVVALRAPSLAEGWRWLRRPESRTVVATVVSGAGALAAVHAHHGTIIWEWWFHWRHGLPLILPIALSLAVALTSDRAWIRAAAVGLVVLSLGTGAVAVRETVDFLRSATRGPSPSEAALVDWVDAAEPPGRLVSTKAQALAAFSRRAGFHWMTCADDPRQTWVLLGAAGGDYLVLYPGEEACPAVGPLLDRLRLVATFGDLRVLAVDGPRDGARL